MNSEALRSGRSRLNYSGRMFEMVASYDNEVQLEGDQLAEARRTEGEVTSSLTAMADVIVKAMEGPYHRAVSAADIKFTYGAAGAGLTHGAHVLVVHGPEYCYVYDGNVGICRPCTPAEEVQ